MGVFRQMSHLEILHAAHHGVPSHHNVGHLKATQAITATAITATTIAAKITARRREGAEDAREETNVASGKQPMVARYRVCSDVGVTRMSYFLLTGHGRLIHS